MPEPRKAGISQARRYARNPDTKRRLDDTPADVRAKERAALREARRAQTEYYGDRIDRYKRGKAERAVKQRLGVPNTPTRKQSAAEVKANLAKKAPSRIKPVAKKGSVRRGKRGRY